MAAQETGAVVTAAASGTTVDAVTMSVVNTTSSTAVSSTGSATITLGSATNVVNGMALTVDSGANQEVLPGSSVTISGTSLTATFAKTHSGTYAVSFNPSRQVMAVGDPVNPAQIANVDTSNRLNTTIPDIVSTGNTLSMSSTSNAVTINTSGNSTIHVQTSGSWTGQITPEFTTDGTNWVAVGNFTNISTASVTGTVITSNSIVCIIVAGVQQIRLRCSTTGTNSATIGYVLSTGIRQILLSNIGASGSIGSVGIAQWGGTSINPVTPADALNNSINALNAVPYTMAYNGTTWDRVRKDTYATGPQWVSGGGGSAKYIAAAAGTTVIKGTAGRLCKVLVTGGTITAALTLYDNATTTTGNVIAVIPATATVTGVPYVFDWPCANGITGDFLAGSPAVSISYW